jgi:type IV pilus assembly protein PilC
MVAAGEVGGVLDEVLERLAVMLEKNAKTASEIKSAMSYPKTVMFIALAVFFGMTTFLLQLLLRFLSKLVRSFLV